MLQAFNPSMRSMNLGLAAETLTFSTHRWYIPPLQKQLINYSIGYTLECSMTTVSGKNFTGDTLVTSPVIEA